MKKIKLVVIGNGMAGMRTVENLIKVAPDSFDITVFGDEPYPNYNRIMLSPVLADEQTIDDIILHTRDWYRDNQIGLHTGTLVTQIDRTAKTVTTDNDITVPYDYLLIATGSKPFIPPFPGKDLDGVISYRDIHDTNTMIEATQRYKNAIVIGGGLLGLEAANGLNIRGMNVSVIHRSNWLLEKQLDKTAADLLQVYLEDKGISFYLSANTQTIIGDDAGHLIGLQLESGIALEASLVVIAVGIRPNFSLAASAGLACERGIVVNDHLQTSDPSIYAVGECVNHRGMNYGLVAPLYEMAAECANHLAGLETAGYAGSVISTKLKVTGVDLFSAGDFMGTENSETITLQDTVNGSYKKLVIEDNKLIGSCLYGDTVDGAWYFDLLREGKDITDIRNLLMFGQDSLHLQAPEPVVAARA